MTPTPNKDQDMDFIEFGQRVVDGLARLETHQKAQTAAIVELQKDMKTALIPFLFLKWSAAATASLASFGGLLYVVYQFITKIP